MNNTIRCDGILNELITISENLIKKISYIEAKKHNMTTGLTVATQTDFEMTNVSELIKEKTNYLPNLNSHLS
jgi:hypothetical protein